MQENQKKGFSHGGGLLGGVFMRETQKALSVDEAGNGYNGSIPSTAFDALEGELAGLIHGTAVLTIHIKDGHLLRYVTSRERSFVPGKPMTGGNDGY